MGQTEIDEYEEVTPEGKVIARYTVTEHTNLRGLIQHAPSKSRLSPNQHATLSENTNIKTTRHEHGSLASPIDAPRP